MTRTARCCCQRLEVACSGDPASVSLCHCLECQRRTGSAFGVAAFYPRDAVVTRGATACYLRPSDSGFEVAFHFCPTCGSTVYWEPERKPAMIAVAVGAFADPGFPAPGKAAYDEHRHPWAAVDL